MTRIFRTPLTGGYEEIALHELPSQRSLCQIMREHFNIEETQPLIPRPNFCTKKRAAVVLLGLVVIASIAVLYWYLAQEDKSASVFYPTAAPKPNSTTFFPTTASKPNTTTFFPTTATTRTVSPITQNASTLATTTTLPPTTPITTTTGPSTPTPDPRCVQVPDCCDSQGRWICGR